jgi:hypothetical protein
MRRFQSPGGRSPGRPNASARPLRTPSPVFRATLPPLAGNERDTWTTPLASACHVILIPPPAVSHGDDSNLLCARRNCCSCDGDSGGSSSSSSRVARRGYNKMRNVHGPLDCSHGTRYRLCVRRIFTSVRLSVCHARLPAHIRTRSYIFI